MTTMLEAIHQVASDPIAWLALRDWYEEHSLPWQQPSLTNSIGMRMMLIPTGKFLMGSPEGEEGRSEDEGPVHLVGISRPFYLGAFQVTQEQYQKVMGTTPSWFSREGEGAAKVEGMDTSRFPVEQVSWEDAMEFCRRLSEMPEEKAAGRKYSLPSESQWEYACRGNSPSYQVFHFGDSLSSHQANFNGNYPYGGWEKGPYLQRTTEVGSYLPNAFGLFDMHGNVWEWCSDRYRPYREQEPESQEGGSSEESPLGVSAAAAGSAAAGSAGLRTATGTSRTPGATSSVSGWPADSEASEEDPLESSEEAVGSTGSSSAGRRPATGSTRSAGTATWVSESASEQEASEEVPFGSYEVAAGLVTASDVGHRTDSGSEWIFGTGTSASESASPHQEGGNSEESPFGSSEAVAGSATAGTAVRGSAAGTSRATESGASGYGSVSPPIEKIGSSRVIRGGSWRSFGGRCRSADRCWYSPGFRNLILGFRAALEG